MEHRITIPGRFNSLNEYIDACRSDPRKGARMKRGDQSIIFYYIRTRLENELQPKVVLKYHFFEKNTRRDLDNVAGYFHKIFQDALVEAKFLENDGWKQIKGFSDDFDVDPDFPRIEVIMEDGFD